MSRTVRDAAPGGTELETIQRRTIRVLVTSQVLGGVGVSSGIAVGALLASRVLGRADLAGLVQSTQVLGAALLALPTARLALARGRRAGLGAGYGLAVLGAALAVVSAEVRSFPLLLLGTALFGGGTTAGLQARYAATDLAPPTGRGKALSVVVWSTTVGAVAGPNLVGPAGRLAASIGIEPLAGPFLVGGVGLALASVVVLRAMRPDPLETAKLVAGEAAGGQPPWGPGRRRGALRHGLAAASHSARALLGLLAVVVAHTVMVAVMVMTPIHMDHGGASLEIIGFVISLHVAGMFAFAPVMGWLADRYGRIPVVVGGGVVLLAAVALSGTSPEGSSPGLGAGLFLLGLGWSACLVAGSVLITDALPVADRPAAQGVGAHHRRPAGRGPAGGSGRLRPAHGPGRRGRWSRGWSGGGSARLWGAQRRCLGPRARAAGSRGAPGVSPPFEHPFGLGCTSSVAPRPCPQVGPGRDDLSEPATSVRV